ncbi:hypothetical protein VTL71DRAFT_7170 [Oculimacula yallundae]|uniref:C2H2-type domain-containing protein n=1 Tax=Oculimacula yallundae TaxID=86028 RepID=A0ABR4BVY3_9HELO
MSPPKPSAELIRSGQAGALQSFVRDNSVSALVYNDGNIIVPSNYQYPPGTGVYNGPTGTIRIQDVSATCTFCTTRFDNKKLLAQHNWTSFKKCSVHGMCFGNWTEHMRHHEHTICGVQSCAQRGTNFNTVANHKNHFLNYHQSHCYAENARIGRGFCEPCYWQYGISHDSRVSKCRV